ncbi:MAG: LamG-like jellyroll fold domain-containing protein [Bacteroidales bacterium]
MKKIIFLFVLMLSKILVVSTVISQTLPDPIASYSFDVDASDATGNFNGTLEADAVIVEDAERGSVLQLVDSGYVSIPPEIANDMEDFSFAAWVNFGGNVTWAGLLGMGKSIKSGFPYWDFHIRGDSSLSFYSSVNVVWPSDGCARIVNDFKMPDEWVHIALSFAMNDTAVVYINGEVKSTRNWTGPQNNNVSPKLVAPEVVTIGRDTWNQGVIKNTLIDDFKFYKIAITAEEAAAIYADQGISGIEKNNSQLMNHYVDQNSPNPFNTETTIKFNIPEGRKVKLSVYNIFGQEVAVLVDDFRTAGTHSVIFNGADLTSGFYFYRLESNGHSTTKRMCLLK